MSFFWTLFLDQIVPTPDDVPRLNVKPLNSVKGVISCPVPGGEMTGNAHSCGVRRERDTVTDITGVSWRSGWSIRAHIRREHDFSRYGFTIGQDALQGRHLENAQHTSQNLRFLSEGS